MALEFTEENFESLAVKSDKLVMIDFWAEWCGPCRMVGPLVDENFIILVSLFLQFKLSI